MELGDSLTDSLPDTHVSKRLPFGIYAIVFFLGIHIAALVLELLRLQFGYVIDFLAQASEIVVSQLGLGGVTDGLMKNQAINVWFNGVVIVLLAINIAGLLARQRWAWVLTMILIGISLLISIVDYFNDSPRYLNMLVAVAIVFYLNERSVQQVYEKRRRAQEVAM